MHLEKKRNAHPSGSHAGRRSAILPKSAPSQHHIDLLPAKHVTWAFPASIPQAPHASSASAHERPPHASGLPAPPDESTFPRAPSEKAPQHASPLEREPAPPPLASARTPRQRGRASSPRDRAHAEKRPRLRTWLEHCPPRRAAPLPWPPRERAPPSGVHGRRCLLRVHGRRRLPLGSRVCLRALFAFEWGTNE